MLNGMKTKLRIFILLMAMVIFGWSIPLASWNFAPEAQAGHNLITLDASQAAALERIAVSLEIIAGQRGSWKYGQRPGGW